MKLTQIHKTDYDDWKDYYWNYQFILAKEYYIPLLKKWGYNFSNKKILDIGCGNGGFTAAFGEHCNITGIDIKSFSYETLPNDIFDVIINGTSLSLSSEVPPVSRNIINKNTFCYDLMYSSDKTVFIKWAIENGALRAADGLGMLVEQAAESFFIWHGVKPNTAKVIEALKNL